MFPALLTTELPLIVLRLVDESPKPEDVKAGWTAFIIFLLLAVAVAVLGFSLVKQLRKAQAARDAGVYGDEPVVDRGATGATGMDESTTDDSPRTTERP